MKKVFTRMSAAVLAATCLLSLAACGGSNNNSKDDTSKVSSAAVSTAAGEESSQAAELSSTAEESSQPANESMGYTTLEDFINSDETQKDLKELQDSMAEQGMGVDITAEGNKMILSFDLGNAVEEETAADAAEGLVTLMDSAFEEMADSLAESLGTNDTALEVKFLYNGEEVYSQEYSVTYE